MAVLDSLTFDTLTQGQAVTTAALPGEEWVYFGTATATSAAAMHGARGVQIVAAATSSRVNHALASATSAARCLSFYFRLDATPTANVYLGELRDDTTGQVVRADWRVAADRTVTLRNGGTATGGSSTEALAVGTWYRSEWLVSSTGQELRIFEGESTTPFLTRTGALTSNAHTTMGAGLTASPNGLSISLDTIRIGDTWVGPFGTPDVPLDTPTGFTFVADPGPNVIEIDVSATPVAGAANYQIEVEVLQAGSWAPLGTFSTSTLPFTLDDDDGLEEGRTYRGRMRALPAGW